MSASSLRELPPEVRASGATVSIASSRWSVLARRTVYFGHQSVGSGIVAGVEGLMREYEILLRVVQSPEPTGVTGPAFVHFLVGQKRDYASKNAALLRLLESSTRPQRVLVLLKYCYGDIKCLSDAATMFGAYRDTVDTIQSEHPDVTVIHATIPLTTVESALKSRAKQVIGHPSRREAAVGRHRYNELVRNEFGSSEPVFDVAKVEAAQADGTAAGFTSNGSLIETLAPRNTHDGAHMNRRCQRTAASALLDVLSEVIEADR
jgi:hypothetical protein